MTGFKNFHMGRSWTDTHLEDECPCPQEPCGLIDQAKALAECPQHGFGKGKTMRQVHDFEHCPSVIEDREIVEIVKERTKPGSPPARPLQELADELGIDLKKL